MTEGQVDVPLAEVAPVTRRRQALAFGRTAGGIAAIGVKELRGRMRGRRAFVIVTIYLALLAGFAWMIGSLVAQGYSSGFGGSSAFASAAIGQGVFAALLMLMTLQVVFLAPAATSGAISLEREKQTLDLLAATPISSLAIVVGKLLSALVYLFLLIAASIPLMAIVLVVTALGLGSFGLFCSSLVKRTTAATAVTIFGVLAMTIGTAFVLIFWAAMGTFDNNGNRTGGPLGIRSPTILAYVNPFIAQADVMCGTESTFGAWCSAVNSLVPSRNGIIFTEEGASSGPVMVEAVDDVRATVRDVGVQVLRGEQPPDVQQVDQFGVARDQLWPKSVITWLILSVVFIVLSIQFVTPTRRWHLPRRRRRQSPES
jgi:ABC-type transport system involved in multi-copper enzyme maturation permease subunit